MIMSTFSLSSVYAQLTSFANLSNFWDLFETAFGSSYDFATAASFQSQWQNQDFSLFPQIEVVSIDVLGTANGAYGISTNRIYLSDQFVSVASQQSLDAVILEEFGHFVDAQVNATDTAGDEGELFSALVRGVNLSAAELGRIKAEDDHAVVVIEGQQVAIEQSAGTIIQLTNNNTNDEFPQISGNNVVWRHYGTYFYNGTTTTQLSSNIGWEGSPQISGNNVVWRDFDGNDYEIYFYNGITTTQLTNNDKDDRSPQISGNNVVWEGADEIYFYNGTTTTQLTNSNTNDRSPQISGNNVVWYGSDSSNYFSDSEIYFYNGTTTTQLTNNNTDDIFPQISANNVVWVGSGKIFFYNGTTTIQLTDNNTSVSPQISGNNVVWFEGVANGSQIYFYNGTTTIQLGNDYTFDVSPQISGNNIVWESSTGYLDDYEIYFYNGTTTTQLTDNNTNDLSPQISGNNIVWYGYDGNDYEIYTYQISPTLPTLSIAPTNASQAEGNSETKAFTFTVTRSVNTTGINAVNWTVIGSGTNPANVTDFAGGVLPTGTVSFAVGETSKVITVNVQGDLTSEPNDGFAVTLSSPTNGATISTATASGTIQNDDFPSITLAVAPANVLEDGTPNLLYTFTRTGDTTNALTVNYSITGTADATDYTGATPGTGKTIAFTAGSATATLTIDPTADALVELDETVILTLATGTDYTIGTTSSITGTITNDDYNGSPTDLNLSNNAIAENQPIGTAIDTLTTTAPDTSNTFTYSLVTGTGDTDNALFTITGNQLQSNGIFDYETQNSYSIRVKTTDQGGLTFEKQLTIGVTDLNEIQGNPLINNGRNPIVGTAGPDYLTGGIGSKTLTGGGGNDFFVFTNMRDVGQRIADFTVGEDKLVFTQLFSSLGYTGSNPIADGYIKFVQGTGSNSAHTFLQIDRDGLTGSAIARNFLQIDNITTTQLNNPNNFQF
jgi:serralysin